MPRYVILRHEMPDHATRGLHWDLMLERQGVLRTWAVTAEPRPGGDFEADLLDDHRLEYLDYEGPVSNDRGSVARWDSGDYELIEEAADRVSVTLGGGRMSGPVVLTRTSPGGHSWRVSFGAEPTST